MKNLFIICFLLCSFNLFAQADRWQQRIKYTMDVSLDVSTNIVKGKQKMEYTNNSPDTLRRVFLHLYWNAFQPNSSMDTRSRILGQTVLGTRKDKEGNEVNILDWDDRVKDRIEKMQPNEIGFCKVNKITVAGVAQPTKEHETILEVNLTKPILPKGKMIFETEFECQVPIQIRRSGRDNVEGIRYSMSQWYPKMAEYDYQGWNANPYIAREFYGVWGDFDVKITLDKSYCVAATGNLQTPNSIGFGYETAGNKVAAPTGNTLTWNFKANNVHDFMWAADPTYIHFIRQVKNGATLHFFYKSDGKNDDNWQKMADTCVLAYPLMAKTNGAYAYNTYSFIQGGDGGMEYPMATLIKGPSVGTAIHEWFHSWYQMMLGTNESLYCWMDEGFTSWASTRALAELKGQTGFLHAGSYGGYFDLVKRGLEEPMSTHSDHYNTNLAYSRAAYSKGAVFMEQLGYIVGAKVRDEIIQQYYNTWRFKHPNPNDLIRVAEKVSGMELDWYKEYWVYTTKTIDYAITDEVSTSADGAGTNIVLARLGKMPMPIEVLISFADGTKELHYIPLNLQYGEKPAEDATPRVVHEEWKWTHPKYVLTVNKKLSDIVKIEIDPSLRMADVNRINNKFEYDLRTK